VPGCYADFLLAVGAAADDGHVEPPISVVGCCLGIPPLLTHWLNS
jgi:hypothetical protein